MNLHDVWQLSLDFLPQKPVCVEPVEENLSTDGGLLLLRQWDEQLNVEYSMGIGMNNVLKRNSDELLQNAVEMQETTGLSQRLFAAFEYQAGTWDESRWVVVKCEANAQPTRSAKAMLALGGCG
jgi:hypothetical protein